MHVNYMQAIQMRIYLPVWAYLHKDITVEYHEVLCHLGGDSDLVLP